MKLYKIVFQIKSFHIFPFSFLTKWKVGINTVYLGWKLKRKFKELAWSEEKVWKLTMFCDSFTEAVDLLAFELTSKRRLFSKAQELVLSGYERRWK